MKEKDSYSFDELDELYAQRERIESKKEQLKVYVVQQLEKSHEMEQVEINAINELLNFEESIPRLMGYNSGSKTVH